MQEEKKQISEIEKPPGYPEDDDFVELLDDEGRVSGMTPKADLQDQGVSPLAAE